MSRGKTYVVPPDSEITDEPAHCVRVNVDWIPIVTGLLYKGNLYDYWEQTQDSIRHGKNSIQTIIAKLQSGEGCEIGDMKLRQKPNHDCILQQEQNGRWVDVFDYSKCIAAASSTQLDQLSDFQEEYNRVINYYYDNDYNYIYPDLRNSSKVNLIALFCLGLSLTVNVLTELIAKIITNEIDDQRDRYENDLAITSVVLSGLEVAAGISAKAAAAYPPLVLITALAAVLAEIVLRIRQSAAESEAAIYRDEFRRERIACAWYTALFADKNDDYFPTYSDVIGSLYSAVLVGDDDKVRLRILEINYEELFAALLSYLDDVVSASRVFDFRCKCSNWKVTFDFTQSQHGWKAYNTLGDGAPWPRWYEGQGWRVPDLGDGYWENILLMHKARFRMKRFSIALSEELLFPNSGVWYVPDTVPRLFFRRDLPSGLYYYTANGQWLGINFSDEQICNGIQLGVTGDSVVGAFYNPLTMFVTHINLYGTGLCPFSNAYEWDGVSW